MCVRARVCVHAVVTVITVIAVVTVMVTVLVLVGTVGVAVGCLVTNDIAVTLVTVMGCY